VRLQRSGQNEAFIVALFPIQDRGIHTIYVLPSMSREKKTLLGLSATGEVLCNPKLNKRQERLRLEVEHCDLPVKKNHLWVRRHLRMIT